MRSAVPGTGLRRPTNRTGSQPSLFGHCVGAGRRVIGALTATGVSPELMGAYASGASLDGYAEAEARAGDLSERYSGSEYQLTRALPSLRNTTSLPWAA